MHQLTIAADVSPHLAGAAQLRSDLVLANLENFDVMSSDALEMGTPFLERQEPVLVLGVRDGRANDDEIDVGFDTAIASGERAEGDNADGSGVDVDYGSTDRPHQCAARVGQLQQRPDRYVLWNQTEERRR